MEQKNGWFAFWQKLMKCLSKGWGGGGGGGGG